MSEYVLILGSKSDIGRAIAHRFASKGFNAYLAGRNAADIEKDVSDIKLRFEKEAKAVEWDALKLDEHQSVWDSLNPKPSVVVSVAGFMPKQEDAEKSLALQQQTLMTNYNGLVNFLEIATTHLEKEGQGTIIGISSVAGERGRASNYFYGSAKAGFSAYLSGLRNRLAKKGVHVVTVKPGFVYTQMTEGLDLPPLLTAKPEGVAKSVYKAYRKKKNILYTKWFWKYIMLIIRNIPEFMFKKMKL